MEKLVQHIKSQVSISAETMKIVQSRFTEKRYKKKEYLLRFGGSSTEVFFVSTGCVRTYITGFNGVEHNVVFSVENWWAGDLQGFIHKAPATYSIQALENTTVLSISQENWTFLVNEFPAFLAYSRILFRNSVIALESRIAQHLSFTAKERYQYFLNHYPNLIQRIAQKHIASYLGITPEFLSMLRNQKME
ncbi:MAG: Crp/Fnr family transcriptional regulator [Bacteroidota bacterium]